MVELDKPELGPYKTWREASAAAKSLGIYFMAQYWSLRKQDERLPKQPQMAYADFPGWDVFLSNRKFYESWSMAAASARRMNIRNAEHYRKRCGQDPMLMEYPEKYYADFPGWNVFLKNAAEEAYHKVLSGADVEKYQTCAEASQAARRLEITSSTEYLRRYHYDERLPRKPKQFYSDFPGWDNFLGVRVKSFA